MLKRHARAAIVLLPRVQKPSNALADAVVRNPVDVTGSPPYPPTAATLPIARQTPRLVKIKKLFACAKRLFSNHYRMHVKSA